MTTLTIDTLTNPGCLADLIREPVRHLDEIPELADLALPVASMPKDPNA